MNKKILAAALSATLGHTALPNTPITLEAPAIQEIASNGNSSKTLRTQNQQTRMTNNTEEPATTQFANPTVDIEETIEKMLATYPATYRVSSNPLHISTITATDPDTQEAITDITSVTFHKGFRPSQAFRTSKFNQTCAVQLKKGSDIINGYVMGVEEQANKSWALMLMALTPTHPMNETFNTQVIIPKQAQQVTFTVTPKSKDEIRAELRKQFGLDKTVQTIKATSKSRR
jgi:hypothetical protein